MMKDEIAQQSEESKDSMIGVKDKSMEKKHVWGGGGELWSITRDRFMTTIIANLLNISSLFSSTRWRGQKRTETLSTLD